MKKNEFMEELRGRLIGLSEADLKRSLDYYGEMIDDRIEDGLSEEEAVNAVGTPAEIAGEILREMPLSKLVKARVKTNRKMSVWEIVLLVLGSPLWISVLLTLIMAVLSVYLVLWSAIAMLWSVELAIGLGALSGLLLLPISILQGNLWTGVVLFGMGLFLVGLSVFGFFLCLYITKGLCVLSKKLFLFIKSRFIRKEAVR